MPSFPLRGSGIHLFLLNLAGGALLAWAVLALWPWAATGLGVGPIELSSKARWAGGLAIFGLSALLGLGLSLWLEGRLLRPLRGFIDQNQALATGRAELAVPALATAPAPEITGLASTLSLAMRRVTVIEHLSHMIVQSRDPVRLREQMLPVLIEAVNGDRGSLFTLAPEGGYFLGVAEVRGPKPAVDTTVGVRMTQASEPLLRAMELQGEPVLITDSADPAYARLIGDGRIAQHAAGALLGVPLMQLKKMIGYVLVYRTGHGPGFEVGDLGLARSLGAFAAVALENTRNQEAERARTSRLTALAELAARLTTFHRQRDVLAEVVTRGAALVKSATCAVLMVNEGLDALVLTAQLGLSPSELSLSLPLKHPIVHTFLDQGQAFIVEDIDRAMPELRDLLVRPDLGSIYILPLRATGRTLGAITLGFLDHRRPDEAELSVAEMLASVTAAAIQNASAFEGEVEQRNLLSTMAEISRRVSGILDTEWMLNEVCRLLARELNFDWVHVFLVDSSGTSLKYAAGLGPLGESFASRSLALAADDTSLVGRVAVSGKVERQGDATGDAFRAADPGFQQVHSEIGLPIIAHQQVIGVLSVQSVRPKAFGPDDDRLLSVVAEQISVALDNARHHAQVQAQAKLDSLTQVLNHGAFLEALDGLVQDAGASDSPLSLIMLDVDHFKAYNDQFGHVAGDAALSTLVQAIRTNVKMRDAVGRWGGEEFGIALIGATRAQARAVADRIRDTLSKLSPVDRLGRHMPAPTVSQGIAEWGLDAEDADRLVDVADQALYLAKERGRDQVKTAGDK
jgi:diguanylate cyclase (GGDEF)-like protein